MARTPAKPGYSALVVFVALVVVPSAFAPPREANLLARIAVSPAPASGEAVVLTVTVEDRGPDSVIDGTLVTTLPDGVTLLAAHPTKGRCGGSSVVTCAFGILGRGNQAIHDTVASVRLIARVERPGTFEVAAEASAPTAIETIPDDNRVTRTFAVDAYDGPRPFARVLLKLVSATRQSVLVRVTALGPDAARNVRVNGRRLGTLTVGAERAVTLPRVSTVAEQHDGATPTSLAVR